MLNSLSLQANTSSAHPSMTSSFIFQYSHCHLLCLSFPLYSQVSGRGTHCLNILFSIPFFLNFSVPLWILFSIWHWEPFLPSSNSPVSCISPYPLRELLLASNLRALHPDVCFHPSLLYQLIYIHTCVCVRVCMYVYFYMYIFNIHKIEPIFNVLKSVPFKKSLSDFA